MSYRLLRSGITTAILALAVAFLVHVLTHAILAERVQRSAYDALGPTREASAWLTRLTTPDAMTTVIERLAVGDAAARREAKPWSGLPDEQWEEALRVAEAWANTRSWFDQRTPTESSVLLGGQSLTDWLDTMQVETDRNAFNQRLKQLGLGHAWSIHARDAGDVTLTRWPMLRAAATAIRSAHAQAITQLSSADARPVLERFAADPGRMATHMRDTGFEITPAQIQSLAVYAKDQQLIAGIQNALNNTEVSQAVQAQLGSTDLAVVLGALANGDWPAWGDQVIGLKVDPDDVRLTARGAVAQQRWGRAIGNDVPVVYHTPFGLPVGTLWLVGLSLLVCAVGVTNALLMSVTERFNEIATMKCLGAMDRSIMQMFVAEAVIQGILGGTVGVALGLLLTLLRSFSEFGTLLGPGLRAWPDMLGAAGLSLGIGVLLAAVAAIGPSWVASRLAPMEAMRVE